MKLIDGTLLTRHQHLAGSPVEVLEGAETAPHANRILHHPPEACDGGEVMAAVGREQMELQLPLIEDTRGAIVDRPNDAEQRRLCEGGTV